MRNKFILLYLFLHFNASVFSQNSLLKDLGISINLLLVGFFGALLLVKKENKTWKGNLLTLITGSFSATFLTDYILELLSISSPKATSFFGFMVGFASVHIMDFLVNKFFKKEENNDKSN